MTDKDDGGSAFPLQYDPYIDHPAHGRVHRTSVGENVQSGMSLRDWFAGQALAGFMASYPPNEKIDAAVAAMWSYEIADAMIADRAK